MPRRNVNYLKPVKFRDYMTLAEVSDHVERDPSWIRLLEKDGRIPRAIRVKRGKVQVRLWSPAQVEEIIEILSHHHPGRPPGGS
jgi:hypothetical protein